MSDDKIKTVLVDSGFPEALTGEKETRFVYNLLPVGKFYDKRYGELYVSDQMLQQMESNFGKYPTYKVPVKLGHGDGAPSPGEVIGVQAKPEGLEITMTVDKETSEAILKKQYRYMSAEFDETYQDKETGKPVGAVLLGAALVNQPANPYMEPLVLVDDITPGPPEKEPGNGKGTGTGTLSPANPVDTQNPDRGNEEMEKEAVELLKKQLSDMEVREKEARDAMEAAIDEQKAREAKAQEQAAQAQAQIDEAQKKIAELEAENKALNTEKEQAEAAQNESEVKVFCDKWSSQGIPPATIEKIRPLLMNRTTRVIKLSDDDRDDVPTLKFFDELFSGLPKVPMGQIGSGETPSRELSDVEKAKKRGEAIAATVMAK